MPWPPVCSGQIGLINPTLISDCDGDGPFRVLKPLNHAPAIPGVGRSFWVTQLGTRCIKVPIDSGAKEPIKYLPPPHPRQQNNIPVIGCGSKLNRRGKPQVLVHVFPLTDRVSHFGVPVFWLPPPLCHTWILPSLSGIRSSNKRPHSRGARAWRSVA